MDEANCSDLTSYAVEMEKDASLSVDESNLGIAPNRTTEVAYTDCEAQQHCWSQGVELPQDDNNPHSPVKLSEWETSLVVIGIGLLVRRWYTEHDWAN